MKINFSNLAKLFLAGVCFVAVGCTDYGQDIDNLRTEMNDRFEDLESNTIDPLKADLDATKNALTAAQAAIDAHATQHAADIAALQAKDAELDARITEEANKAAKALADKAAELQAAFEAADANLKSELKADLAALSAELVAKAAELQNNIAVVDAKTQANAEAIVKTAQDAAAALAALQAQLEKADKDLEDRLKAADTALAEALRAELATESKKITDMIAAEVESLNNKLAQAVAEFNAALAKTDANVAKNAADILANASNISANSDAIKANADAIAKNADAIAANAAAIEALANTANKAIEDVKASVAATQALLEQQLADAKNELLLAIQEGDKAVQDALLAEIATLEATLTGKIDSLKSELVDKIENLDTELTGKIDGLKSELNAKIDNLGSQLNDKIDTSIAALDVKLNAAVDRLNADVAKNASAIAALQESLEAAVATLEETIATTKAELEKAVKDGDEALAKQIAEVSATLTKALADAVTELTKQMEDYVAALQSQINQINSEISALKTTDADLQNQINALEAALNTTNAAVKKNAENIAGLDAGLKQAVADLTKRDDMLKADMDKMYAYFDDCVNGLKSITSSLRNDLDGHIAAYGLFKAEVEGHLAKLDAQIVELMAKDAAIEKLIADLTARVDANEALLKDVEALAKQNQSDIAQNAADIKANKQLFDEYVLATDKTLEDLKAADAALAAVDAALQASIDDLNVRFTAYQNEIRAELDQHYGDFAKYQSEVEAKFAEVETKFTIQQAKIDANTEAIAKNAEAIAKNVEAIANNEKAIAGNGKLIEQNASAIAQNQTDIAQIKLDIAKNVEDIAKNAMDILTNAGNIANNSAAIAANTAKIEAAKAELAKAIADLDEKYKGITDVLSSRLSALEKAHADLAQAHEKLANEFAEYQLEVAAVFASIEAAQLEQDGKIKLNADQIAALQTQLGNLTTTVENNYKTLTERIDNLEASLTQLIEKVSADLNALKGRIQSLVFVPEYSDGKATIEYAKVGNSVVECESKFLYQVYPAECVAAIKPADLQFVFTEALQTRAAEPMLEIVAVNTKNADKGIFEVVAKAHHLHAIYEGSKEYAVSLVFNGKSSNTETNIASSYTNLIAEKADDVTKITWKLNDSYKKAAELEYIATGSVNVLGGIDYIFSENGTEKSHDYIFEHYGLTVKAVEIAPTYNNDEYTSALDASVKASKDVFKNVVREDHGYDVSIAIAADKATVGLVQTIGYGFNLITVNDNAVVDSLSDYATVEITKIKGHMTLDPQTITWARSKDNDTDGITPKVPTSREVTTVAGKLLDINGAELTTAGTTYADIITGTAAIKVNNEPLAAPYNVVFGGTTDAPTVLFEGFEWDKEYTIVASYEIDNIVAEISIVLTTVQNDSVVTLDPATITWNYAADKKSEPAYAGTDKEATFRAVEVKADNADLYADVIANGKLVKITPDAGFVFTAAGIEATGFAWNQPYAVEALYALEDQLVTVKVAVETVKADFVELPISLEAAQWMLTQAFIDNGNQSKTADEALLPVYEGLTNLGEISAADYLKDIFVNNTFDAVATANTETKVGTKLVIADDGMTIKSTYSLDDFSTVPAAIDYELAVTTWYGQKIKFTKNLNIGLTPVEIELAEKQWKLTPESKIENNALFTDEDGFAALYSELVKKTVDSSLAQADYLSAIFSNIENVVVTTENEDAAGKFTKLVVAADGQSIEMNYSMKDYPTTLKAITYTYSAKAWYGQEFKFTQTLKLGVEPATYELAKIENKDIETKMVFNTNNPAESLAGICEKEAVKNILGEAYSADANAFLKSVLADGTNYVLNANTVNGIEKTKSKFTLIEEGTKAYVSYDYSDEWTATPDDLNYVYEVTTWYGQKLTFTKFIHINKEIKTYNLLHNEAWVEFSWSDFSSIQLAKADSWVQPSYKYNPVGSDAIEAFNVKEIDLNSAYWVLSDGVRLTTGNPATDATILNALGLARKFVCADANIVIDENNVMEYNSKAETVQVDGSLWMKTGIGTEEIELDSSFKTAYVVSDKEKYYYGGYQVHKFDPIGGIEIKDENGDLDILPIESTYYRRNIWQYISLLDNRNGAPGKELIDRENKAWIVGNGTNGFADGRNVAYIDESNTGVYGLKMRMSLDMTSLPEDIQARVQFYPNGDFSFNATGNLVLQKSYEIKVLVHIDYPQGVRDIEVPIKLRKP